MNYREIVNDIINDIKGIKNEIKEKRSNEKNVLKKEKEEKDNKNDKEYQDKIYRSVFDDRDLEEYDKRFYFRSKL